MISRKRKIGLVLTAVLAVGQTAGHAEPPPDGTSVDSQATTTDDAGSRNRRRARRAVRTTADGVASSERQRKRSPRHERRRRGGRERERSQSAEGSPVHLHVSGSYELNLGNDRVIRGEGSTTIHLDRATADKLHTVVRQRLDRAAPAGKDLLKVLASLPKTLESTSEILKSLSDPKTQESLRQVEQLLQLLPRSTPQPDSGSTN
jgi:hypothetical protein